MKTITVFAVMLICAAAQAEHRTIACKTPKTAPACHWIHGRLALYNGTPAFRLWQIGTHHLFGISSGLDAEQINESDNEAPQLPASLIQFDPLNQDAYGDFEICELEPHRVGTMQTACIANAKRVRFAPR